MDPSLGPGRDAGAHADAAGPVADPDFCSKPDFWANPDCGANPDSGAGPDIGSAIAAVQHIGEVSSSGEACRTSKSRDAGRVGRAGRVPAHDHGDPVAGERPGPALAEPCDAGARCCRHLGRVALHPDDSGLRSSRTGGPPIGGTAVDVTY